MSAAPEFEGDFEKDVPAHLQEQVMERICESYYGGKDWEGVTITDVFKRNVTNATISGVVEIEGREHDFIIDDGDDNGTVIREWNTGRTYEPEPRESLVVAPRFVSAGGAAEARTMLEEWRAVIDGTSEVGKEIGEAARKYAYDSFFAPGTGAAKTHDDKARAHGYEVVEESVAVDRRKALLDQIHVLEPNRLIASGRLKDRPAEIAITERSSAEILSFWLEKDVPGSPIAALRNSILSRVAKAGRDAPAVEDHIVMEAEGFRFVTPGQAVRTMAGLAADLFRLEEVEGFDPATLPKNPVAELFRALDPSLVSDTRVNPHHWASRVLDSEFRRMGRDRNLEISETAQASLAEVGFRLVPKSLDAPEADVGTSSEMEP